jgi:superfamily II DNA or RNA helicase
MPRTAVRWTEPPRILSEHLTSLAEPLACLLAPGAVDSPAAVATGAARALLDLLGDEARHKAWPAWLAPHQIPAAERLVAMLARHGGALLADAVGLGKSYVALATALAIGDSFALVVPAVLVSQWRALLARHGADAPIVTHEALSSGTARLTARPPVRLVLVDEAHRFRNPETGRYRALARLVVGARVLLVTATPVHNRVGDLCHLLRLFLRDDALTALEVPSLCGAARGRVDPRALHAAAARLCVARSRERVRAAYDAGPAPLSFPECSASRSFRIGSAPEPVLAELVAGIHRLEAGGAAAALFRLVLLSQLGSSLPAFRASLARYDAFLELGAAAAAEGKMLGRRDFQRLFPAEHDALQLALLPLLLPPGESAATQRDLCLVRRLRELSEMTSDPKADALAGLLHERSAKTIVFVQARATVRHLLRRLRGCRVAAVTGARGWFGTTPVGREEVLRAFAPRSQGACAPVSALETDVLVATDILSEGLNLQDASRVIHYDLPWSPARLAQRVGRVDRAASPHERIETVTFLPPPPLADAITIEQRLAAKRRAQVEAGAGPHGLDWCDRLHRIGTGSGAGAAPGSCAAVAGDDAAVVLVVRIGRMVEAVVVTDAGAEADPAGAAVLLERAAAGDSVPLDRARLERALRQAAPLVRRRLAAIEAARWRAADRDRVSRRLIPWVLAAARRAAARRRHTELTRLDGLVSRLALGMTAGEELLLEDLLARRSPVSVRDVLTWHERLPPVEAGAEVPQVELVAAMLVG